MTTRVKDSGWHKRIRDMLKEHSVTIGIHERDNGRSEDGQTNAVIGYKHEYGEGVPQRSFLRATMDDKEAEARRYVRRGFEKIARGLLSEAAFWDMMGSWGVSKVVAKINSNIPPPLADSTIQRKTVQGKQGDVALVDTGDMKQAINYEVK